MKIRFSSSSKIKGTKDNTEKKKKGERKKTEFIVGIDMNSDARILFTFACVEQTLA